MALKGKARIELTNVDGSKQIVEHNNMITDAVKDLLCTSRGEMSNIMRISDNNKPYPAQIFGGILLFNDVLTATADDYYIPSLNITGYASQSAYAGLDTSRGSFNESESGLQSDGSYKLVWDFSTAQANGTIKSIGLCPNIMGRIGASNSIVASERVELAVDKDSALPFNKNQYMLDGNGSTEGISNYCFNIVAVIDNIAYAVDSYNISYNSKDTTRCLKNNGYILKLYRFDIGLSSVGLSNVVGMATYIDCIDVKLPTDFTSILSTANVNYVDYSYDPDNKILTVYPCILKTNLTQGSTLKYVNISLNDNMNVTTGSFVYQGGDTFNGTQNVVSACSDNGAYAIMHMTTNYVVTVGKGLSDNSVYKIYITRRGNGTDVKTAKDESGNDIILGNTQNESRIRPIYAFNDIFVFATVQGSQYTQFTHCYIVDLKTGLMKETNAKSLTHRSNVMLNNKATWGKTGAYLALKVAVNPFILTTKNNLDSPVTKTASQTMKITYTLTESEG